MYVCMYVCLYVCYIYIYIYIYTYPLPLHPPRVLDMGVPNSLRVSVTGPDFSIWEYINRVVLSETIASQRNLRHYVCSIRTLRHYACSIRV